jgi:hypothetical protein
MTKIKKEKKLKKLSIKDVEKLSKIVKKLSEAVKLMISLCKKNKILKWVRGGDL